MAMNFMIYPLGCFAFWVYGFAIGWGNWWNGPVPPGWYAVARPGRVDAQRRLGHRWRPRGVFKYGLIGTKGFFLYGMEDVSVMALFFFMMVFMDTTATIPTGVDGRALGLEELLPVRPVGRAALLPLRQLGVGRRLAGSGRQELGSRPRGRRLCRLRRRPCDGRRHRPGRRTRHRSAHRQVRRRQAAADCPATTFRWSSLGTFILAFGWFGFNPGSTLAGTDLRISAVVVNTMLASVTGALATMCYLMMTGKKPDPSMMFNGMLAGLVAITAPCAFVDSWAACVIGAIAGVLVVVGVFFCDKLASTIRSAPFRSTASTASGASSRSASSPTASTAPVGTASSARRWSTKYGSDGVRGILYGDASQLWAQLLDAAVVAGVRLRAWPTSGSRSAT